MEETVITTKKSLLEKMAPFVLVIFLIALAYFGLTKIKLGGGSSVTSTISNSTQTINQVQVDVEFLNSDAFKRLKFIPDSPVFNPATGTIPAGREDPFAPVY